MGKHVLCVLAIAWMAWGCTSKNQQEQPGLEGTPKASPVKESTSKTETPQDEGAFICFPDDVERKWQNGAGITTAEAVEGIRNGIPLKISLTHGQLCDEEVQQALLGREGPLDIHLHSGAFADTALLPCLEPLKPRLCGLGGPLTDALAPLLKDFPSLRSFDPGKSFTDAGLSHLSHLKNVQKLNLKGIPITDAGVAALMGLTSLQELILWRTLITDEGVAHLSGLKNLQKLSLGGTAVTDEGVAHLSGLKNLQELILAKTSVTAGALSHLVHLVNLEELDLSFTPVTDEGLAHLIGLKKLQKLWLWKTQITDVGVAHLSIMKNLRGVWLYGTGVTDAGLSHLGALKNLRVVGLTNTPVTDVGVAKFQAQLPQCHIDR